ncbi:hypothetical protein FIBSPDRAFT_894053 [Athelia psychrophila]|uniref:Uncharacterized protein n=1 Tax=Athelia psychrophila TaxID=1759441 RepID=A0A166GAU3_9AGAM|nr:hypothetical protein FIBSPDRAFT_894053 [Fibularhizoctonia sp. CBS 109695]
MKQLASSVPGQLIANVRAEGADARGVAEEAQAEEVEGAVGALRGVELVVAGVAVPREEVALERGLVRLLPRQPALARAPLELVPLALRAFHARAAQARLLARVPPARALLQPLPPHLAEGLAELAPPQAALLPAAAAPAARRARSRPLPAHAALHPPQNPARHYNRPPPPAHLAEGAPPLAADALAPAEPRAPPGPPPLAPPGLPPPPAPHHEAAAVLPAEVELGARRRAQLPADLQRRHREDLRRGDRLELALARVQAPLRQVAPHASRRRGPGALSPPSNSPLSEFFPKRPFGTLVVTANWIAPAL